MAKRSRAQPAAKQPSAGKKRTATDKNRAAAGKKRSAADRPAGQSLEEYRRKRRFDRTAEPAGSPRRRRRGALRFVVQKHAARREHYDLRLEIGDVLKSWAVPKGPSDDPNDKRLAIETEDHPLEYGEFEGVIPEGEYGAGAVLIWDQGTYEPEEDPAEGYRQGKISVQFHGQRMQGSWALVRLQGQEKHWLLIKHRDAQARRGKAAPLTQQDTSVVSGRTLEEIAGRPQARRGKPVRRSAPGDDPPLAALAGVKQAALPAFIEPQLATLEARAPTGQQWQHEMKFDGYRMLCRIDGGKVRFLSRRGQDWTRRFAPLADAAQKLPCRQALLDGEVVVLTAQGTSSFQALQNLLRQPQGLGNLLYYAFDLLYLDGYDLRGAPLAQRGEVLQDLLAAATGRIRYSEALVGDGPTVFEQACRLGLEGIVSKRRDRPYRSGRHRDWLKVKCLHSQEFLIGGYTRPEGSRQGFGALLLGYYDRQRRLHYAGRVGTGFSEATLADLRRRLDELRTEEPPFARFPKSETRRGVTWVQPRLVAQVQFTQWTHDGRLRHPTFLALREDKLPEEVVREGPGAAPAAAADVPAFASAQDVQELAGVRLTSAHRVMDPVQGVTKLGLANYYAQVAEWMLPHLVDRPLALVRCPEGRHEDCFYQKRAPAGLPAAVRRVEVAVGRRREEHLYVDDLAGVLTLVQFGVLEFHVWGSRVDRPEYPDRLVFDLDPDPAVAWPRVVQSALDLREFLRQLGLESFARLTGGKGIHVVVPIMRRHDWGDVKPLCRQMVVRFAQSDPPRYVVKATRSARQGRIYLDYLRNAAGATAIAAYSTRARPGAPVAVPVSWDELPQMPSADVFNVDRLPRRLAQLKADPWRAMGEVRQSLSKSLREAL